MRHNARDPFLRHSVGPLVSGICWVVDLVRVEVTLEEELRAPSEVQRQI